MNILKLITCFSEKWPPFLFLHLVRKFSSFRCSRVPLFHHFLLLTILSEPLSSSSRLLWTIYFAHGLSNLLSHPRLLFLPLLLPLFLSVCSCPFLSFSTPQGNTCGGKQSTASPLATQRVSACVCLSVHKATVDKEMLLSCVDGMPGRSVMSEIMVLIIVSVCVYVLSFPIIKSLFNILIGV